MTYEPDSDFKLEKISVAGVSDIAKLEKWLETNRAAQTEAHRRINFLRNEVWKWQGISARAYKQIGRLERKLKNLKRVKEGEDLPLNCWYEILPGSYYFYLIKITPAGRGAGMQLCREKVRDKRAHSMRWTDGWEICKEYMDSAELKECGQLTVLITTGTNFNPLVQFAQKMKRGDYRRYVVEKDKLILVDKGNWNA